MRSYVFFLFALCFVLGLAHASKEEKSNEDPESREGPCRSVENRVKRQWKERLNDVETPWRTNILNLLLGGFNGGVLGGGLAGGAGVGLDRRIITSNIIKLSNRLDTLIAQANNILNNQG